jgi:phage gp29-like protein
VKNWKRSKLKIPKKAEKAVVILKKTATSKKMALRVKEANSTKASLLKT